MRLWQRGGRIRRPGRADVVAAPHNRVMMMLMMMMMVMMEPMIYPSFNKHRLPVFAPQRCTGNLAGMVK